MRGRCGVGWGGRHLGSLLWEIRLGTGSPELKKKKKKDLIEVGVEHYLLKVYYVLDQLIFLSPLLGTQSS